MSKKNGFSMLETIIPMVRVFPPARLRAWRLGWYFNSSIALTTRARVDVLTTLALLSTRETVAVETLARRATCSRFMFLILYKISQDWDPAARGRSCDSDYRANCWRQQLRTCQAIDEHRCVEDNHLGFSARVNRPADRRARRISFNSASTSRWGRAGISAIMVSKIFRRFWISLSLKRSMRPRYSATASRTIWLCGLARRSAAVLDPMNGLRIQRK